MTNSDLDILAREKRREYYRQWRAKNKDKIHQYNQRYWARKATEQRKETEVTENG